MSPFKLGDFLGKLTHVELKKHFQKKRVSQSSYSHRTWRIAGIVKYAKVEISPMHPSDRLTEQNRIRLMGAAIKIYEPALALAKKPEINPGQILEVGVGTDKKIFVEPKKGINRNLFNFEESVTEIFYLLFNKPAAIQLPKAIMIPITALKY